jgi:hypothetical protein
VVVAQVTGALRFRLRMTEFELPGRVSIVRWPETRKSVELKSARIRLEGRLEVLEATLWRSRVVSFVLRLPFVWRPLTRMARGLIDQIIRSEHLYQTAKRETHSAGFVDDWGDSHPVYELLATLERERASLEVLVLKRNGAPIRTRTLGANLPFLIHRQRPR